MIGGGGYVCGCRAEAGAAPRGGGRGVGEGVGVLERGT